MNASTWNAYTSAQRIAVVTASKDQRFAYVNGQMIGQTDLAGAKLDATTRLTAYSSSDVGAGSVTVNGFPAPFPHVPFGGFKQSGLGRELGLHGLRSYLEPQSLGLPPSLRG